MKLKCNINTLNEGRIQEIKSIHILKVSEEVSERGLLTASQTRKYCKALNELVYE